VAFVMLLGLNLRASGHEKKEKKNTFRWFF
jgi:hypothetical protein